MSADSGVRRSDEPRLWRLVGRVAIVVAASITVGMATVVGVAVVSLRPMVLLVSGLGAGAAVGAAGILWVARRQVGPRRRRLLWGTSAILAVSMGVVTLLFAVPSGDVGSPAAAVDGESYWSLPTGSKLRYVGVPASGTARPTPVVFVHGGPGTPDLVRDIAYFGRLAEDGFDVYVYDQFGAGGSTRLTDPEQYGRDRDVADLEAIRQAIGAEQLILIGHSYGATVVAGYLAAHPMRVARTLLASPASLDPADSSGGNLQSRLTRDQRLELYARLLRPRNLLIYTLLQVNPALAHQVAGDAEMDAQNDLVYAATEPALHCPGHALETPPTGLGFYRLQYPQSAAAPADRDLRPLLAGNDTPTLLVKGSCDYLSWESVVTYLETLSDAQLVYMSGGHNVHHDAPEEFLATARAFLTDSPLPIAPYSGTTVPSDYEGAR
ncbi:alpha/beta hydrolase [Pseudactinotalea sp. Z1748]|uniref:alpha/beta hydrolase n=1 Tax=Pseudactinotalea sp. Z1748 TaxID=3413027 RepID=UPI003C7C91AC